MEATGVFPLVRSDCWQVRFEGGWAIRRRLRPSAWKKQSSTAKAADAAATAAGKTLSAKSGTGPEIGIYGNSFGIVIDNGTDATRS